MNNWKKNIFILKLISLTYRNLKYRKVTKLQLNFDNKNELSIEIALGQLKI